VPCNSLTGVMARSLVKVNSLPLAVMDRVMFVSSMDDAFHWYKEKNTPTVHCFRDL
jgi:hypothetical protein